MQYTKNQLKNLLSGVQPIQTRADAIALARDCGEPVVFREGRTRAVVTGMVGMTVEQLRAACDMSPNRELAAQKKLSVLGLPEQHQIAITRADFMRLIGEDVAGVDRKQITKPQLPAAKKEESK